ncbi:MAG: prepilin-type N-terminal cleavage/methylation domain-containing protein [Planctomycetes bacterium]|nr:prepilin-type N-terminal cleavage/methylation domain-containing protein [Planctomycetota bacterium]
MGTRQERGFTLVEMLVVMVIIALLAAILIPVVTKAREQGRHGRWIEFSNQFRSADTRLVAYYTFEKDKQERAGEGGLENRAVGDLDDTEYSPKKMDGTIKGGGLWVKKGRWGKDTLEFDGVDDHVRIPHSALQNITDEITLMAWIYPLRFGTTGDKGIIRKDASNGATIWHLSLEYVPLKLRFGITANADIILTSTGTIPFGQWTHVAGTYDGSSMRVYINGKLDNSIAQTGSIRTTTEDAGIACKNYWATGGQYFFRGCIDELAVLKRALGPEEILAHYKMGRP